MACTLAGPGCSLSSRQTGRRAGGGHWHDGRSGLLRATQKQHNSRRGKDQHAGNTNKTAFTGTRRHDR